MLQMRDVALTVDWHVTTAKISIPQNFSPLWNYSIYCVMNGLACTCNLNADKNVLKETTFAKARRLDNIKTHLRKIRVVRTAVW